MDSLFTFREGETVYAAHPLGEDDVDPDPTAGRCQAVHAEPGDAGVVVHGNAQRVPFPQADDLDKVAEAAVAIGLGLRTSSAIAHRLGVGERNGHYYGAAAVYLGLASRSRDGFEPTDRGRRFVLASREERAGMIGRVLWNRPVFLDMLYSWLLDGDYPNVHAAREYLGRHTDLAESTCRRRARTVVAWCEWLLEQGAWDAGSPRIDEGVSA